MANQALRRTARQIFSTLWYDESCCQLCGSDKGPICPSCEREYFHPELARCLSCGKLISPQQDSCQDCKEGKAPRYLTQVLAWGHYEGAWKKLIQDVKFQSQPFRLGALGLPLGKWFAQHLPPVEALIPVPMHPSRRAERGFNQAEVIASLLHWELGIPLANGLDRITPTTSQVLLSRRERLTNLTGAFLLAASDLQGRKVCLIDDVTTTGATLEACAQELRRGGVKEIYAFCLAAGKEKELVQPWD